jgi:hypothetical protein
MISMVLSKVNFGKPVSKGKIEPVIYNKLLIQIVAEFNKIQPI